MQEKEKSKEAKAYECGKSNTNDRWLVETHTEGEREGEGERERERKPGLTWLPPSAWVHSAASTISSILPRHICQTDFLSFFYFLFWQGVFRTPE